MVLIYASVTVWFTAGVAQLGQRRWDEVPVRNGSQVQILPPAPNRHSKTIFDKLDSSLNDDLIIVCERLMTGSYGTQGHL